MSQEKTALEKAVEEGWAVTEKTETTRITVHGARDVEHAREILAQRGIHVEPRCYPAGRDQPAPEERKD